MNRSMLLAAIALSFSMIVAGAVSWAQIDEQSPCVEACREAEDQCVDVCDVHPNPVECEENCQEAAEDCIQECR